VFTRIRKTVCILMGHKWGTAYRSSGGRRVCVRCNYVTDKPFDTLGVGESGR